MYRLAAIPLVLLLAAACRSGLDGGVTVHDNPPATTLTEPAPDATFAVGDAVTFRGIVDDDGGSENLLIQWTSAIDGVIDDTTVPDASGNVEFSTASLSIGSHVITLRAIDDEAQSGESQVTVHVEGIREEPTLEVIRPIGGEPGGEGTPFPFSARVSDVQDPPTSVLVTITFDGTGQICSLFGDANGVVTCGASLPLGGHLVDFVATDLDGFQTRISVPFNVLSPLDVDDDGDGVTENQGDCNDANVTVFPGASEVCDGLDNDCAPGTPIDAGTDCSDDDLDGYTEAQGDCRDNNPAVNPGATEVIDNQDNDCDGLVDEGTGRFDDDFDGYCETPPCTNAAGTQPDCNDGDAAVKPGATEICGNGIDDNCDGTQTAQNAIGCTPFYRDNDGDTYGTGSTTQCHCEGGAPGWTGRTNNDCKDDNPNVNPGQTNYFEVHRGDNSWDYNCDGTQQKQIQATNYCDSAFYGLDCDDNGGGWLNPSIPNCGQSARYSSGCGSEVIGFTSTPPYVILECRADNDANRIQGCR